MTAINQPAVKHDDVANDSEVMEMLQEHVPLALLCDLSSPAGPSSAEILAEEGRPAVSWWKQ